MVQTLGFIFVFLINLSDINPNSWIVSSMASIIFIFFESLGLWLICVSSREIVGFSFVFVFVPVLVLLTSFIFFFLG